MKPKLGVLAVFFGAAFCSFVLGGCGKSAAEVKPAVAFGTYDTVKDQVHTVSVDRATHTTAQVGLRLILFP